MLNEMALARRAMRITKLADIIGVGCCRFRGRISASSSFQSATSNFGKR